MKQPVPYVHLTSPASKQVWPNSAACWSPRMPGDRHARQVPGARAVDLGRAADLGEHRSAGSASHRGARHPSRSVARSISIVREAFVTSVTWTPPPTPAGQLPGQPGVDGPEQQVAAFGGGPMPALVQDPGELQRRRVGRDRQPGRGSKPVGAGRIAGRQPRAGLGRPRVLPHDRRMHGPAGASVPHDGRLALVADPDRHELPRGHPCLAQRDLHAGPDALDDLIGVVLDPARPGRDLGVLQLVAGDDPPVVVEQDAATARGPLVDRGDVRRHGLDGNDEREAPKDLPFDDSRSAGGHSRRGLPSSDSPTGSPWWNPSGRHRASGTGPPRWRSRSRR